MTSENLYVGQVLFNAGDEKGDAWDDSELIDYWDKAKEAYKKHQDQQTKKTPPFGTFKKHGVSKRRIEKRIPLKKKDTPSPSRPPATSAQPKSTTPTPPLLNEDDTFTQMIMAWYYAGYYTGLYLGGSDHRMQ